jgi:hypothetical protein
MAAAAGPDENVAAALEEAASEASARGGVSAEAKALEHADEFRGSDIVSATDFPTPP